MLSPEECAWCGETGPKARCARCGTKYCGKDCQMLHWRNGHRQKCEKKEVCRVCGAPGTAGDPLVRLCGCPEPTHSRCFQSCQLCDKKGVLDLGLALEATGNVAGANRNYRSALVEARKKNNSREIAELALAFARTHSACPLSRRRSVRLIIPDQEFQTALDEALKYVKAQPQDAVDLGFTARVCGFAARHHPNSQSAMDAATFATRILGIGSLDRASALVDVGDILTADPTVFMGEKRAWSNMAHRSRRWAHDKALAALETAVQSLHDLSFIDGITPKLEDNPRDPTRETRRRLKDMEEKKRNAVLGHALRNLGYARGARADFDGARSALIEAKEVAVKALKNKERWPCDYLSPAELKETIESLMKNHDSRSSQRAKAFRMRELCEDEFQRFCVGDLVQVRSPCECGSYYHVGVVVCLWPSPKETKPYHVILDDNRDVFPRIDADAFIRINTKCHFRFHRGDKVQAHVDGGYQKGTPSLNFLTLALRYRGPAELYPSR